jgi:hypothetical protein
MSITEKVKSLSKQYLAPFVTGVMSLYACPTAIAVGSRAVNQPGISKTKYSASLLLGGAAGCAFNTWAYHNVSNAEDVVRLIALMVATNVGSAILEAGMLRSSRRWNRLYGKGWANYSSLQAGYVTQREITKPEFNINRYDESCLKSDRDPKYMDMTSAAQIAAEKEMGRQGLRG